MRDVKRENVCYLPEEPAVWSTQRKAKLPDGVDGPNAWRAEEDRKGERGWRRESGIKKAEDTKPLAMRLYSLQTEKKKKGRKKEEHETKDDDTKQQNGSERFICCMKQVNLAGISSWSSRPSFPIFSWWSTALFHFPSFFLSRPSSFYIRDPQSRLWRPVSFPSVRKIQDLVVLVITHCLAYSDSFIYLDSSILNLPPNPQPRELHVSFITWISSKGPLLEVCIQMGNTI